MLCSSICIVVAGALSGCLKTPDRYAASTLDVKVNPPPNFELEGAPFCFVGSNNYYLSFQPKPMVDDVLESARAMGFRVMRLWGFIDRGSIDGSVKSVDGDGTKGGVFFQSWDPAQKRVVYNEEETGLRHLDYALAKAGEVGVKMIVVLTNNWRDFGGMDQYLTWYGRTAHHEFYTAPEVKEAYKNWAAYLIGRTNSVNGRKYREDPTIFAWELGNEPRCKGSGPGAPGWTTATLTNWVGEMSAYIKSLDPNHMVSVGDEGFLNGGGEHWSYKANDGVDHAAITAQRGIDFGTFHMYPEDWGANMKWADGWITDHIRVARDLGKPTVLEEYGVKVSRDEAGLITQGLEKRIPAYERWNELMLRRGGNGSMPWMLAGMEGSKRYRDYDHYTVYKGEETGDLMSEFAKEFATRAPACLNAQASAETEKTPFVRVRRPLARVAFGWGLPDDAGAHAL
jgi:mannan endo-1,4-beta-mannosidase